MLTTNQVIAISAVGTFVVTAAAVLVTLKSVRDELWLQTFSEYTRRFGEVMQQLPSEARDPASGYDFDALDSEGRARGLNTLRLYANLCSEEHYLYSRRKIDKETWRIWTVGIEDMFRLPWFPHAWQALRAEYLFYEPFACLPRRA